MQMQERIDFGDGNNDNNNSKLALYTPALNVPNVPVVHTRVQLDVGQAFTYQGTRGGSSWAHDLRGAHPINAMPVNPPHGGGPRSLHPGYDTPMPNKPDISRQSLLDFHAPQNSYQGHQGITGWDPIMTRSVGACALQSSLKAAIAPQQFPPKQDLSNLSIATGQPSRPPSVLFFEDTSSDNFSSMREDVGSKETVSATKACPFPGCKKRCGRSQELERHIYERHLSPHLYCEQPGCDLTSRRFYLLKNHRADKHPGVAMPEQDAFTIYDAKVLTKQVRNKEIGIEQAVHEACLLFEEKAKQMGKLDIWSWTSGFQP